jgi:acyl-CoA reductase-like NAD-dependent aldehyde dehydrogenase
LSKWTFLKSSIESKTIGQVFKRYTPIGVVGAIIPWNLPVFLSFAKTLAALTAGNTVVLKPSPFAPLTVLRIADYIRELLPAGVCLLTEEASSFRLRLPRFGQSSGDQCKLLL